MPHSSCLGSGPPTMQASACRGASGLFTGTVRGGAPRPGKQPAAPVPAATLIQCSNRSGVRHGSPAKYRGVWFEPVRWVGDGSDAGISLLPWGGLKPPSCQPTTPPHVSRRRCQAGRQSPESLATPSRPSRRSSRYWCRRVIWAFESTIHKKSLETSGGRDR